MPEMLKRHRTRLAGIILCLLLASPLASAQKAEHLLQFVTGIAQSANGIERRQAITSNLEMAGIEYRLDEFVDRRMRQGTNIVVTLPGKTDTGATILIGAHYDRVGVGQGALDNGASCAVLLDLIETVKAQPLSAHTLRVVFFDLEEGGLSGSQAHLETTREQGLPAYGINLDIFGYGDAFFATASNADGQLQSALSQAALESEIPLRIFPPTQYPGSDHRSMIAAGIETLSVTLIDASEIDAIVEVITGRSKVLPPVLATIHTPKDTLEILRTDQMAKALPVIERVIRIIDEK